MLGTLAALVLVPVAAAALLLATPIGSRIAARFYLDDSARVRDLQWSILDRMDWHGLLFGISTDRQHAILYQLGLQFPISVIESLWLILLVDLGVARLPDLALAGIALPGRLVLAPHQCCRPTDAARRACRRLHQLLARPQEQRADRAGARRAGLRPARPAPRTAVFAPLSLVAPRLRQVAPA